MEDDTTSHLSSYFTDTIAASNSIDYVYTASTAGADTISLNDPTDYHDITLRRPGKPPLKVAETLECIMARLAILEPDFDKMEKYPALKEAYDNYKIIEGMLLNNDSDD